MQQLVFLGIGSNSFESLNTSSFAVKLTEGQCLLVDCGPDIPRQLTKAGISFLDIEYVILTHRHLDHCLGLPYFLFGRNLERIARVRRTPDYVPSDLHIISEREVMDGVQSIFRMAHPDIPSLGFGVEYIDIASFLASPLRLGSVELQTFSMKHAVPAYGFIIWSDGRKMLAYSTDTLPVAEFIQAAFGVRVLIHEAMVPASETTFSNSAKHSTTLQAGEAIAQIQPRQAFLMHLRPAFLCKRLQMEQETSKAAGMHTVYPDEGSVISFD